MTQRWNEAVVGLERAASALIQTRSDLPREELVQAARTHLQEVVEAALDEVFGLGPLEPLLRDRTITAIRVDPPLRLIAARGDAETEIERGFRDEPHLHALASHIVQSRGEELTADCALELTMMDGSRLHAAVTEDGIRLNIRRP